MSEIYKKISTRIIGAAGEHYVVSQILRRGYLAALAPDGAPNSDIIVTDINSQSLCSIQVKTRLEASDKMAWRMNQKHEDIKSDNLFYCFVALGKSTDEDIITYIVPSNIVAKLVKLDHQVWCSGLKSNGEKRKDTPIRRFGTDYTKHFKGTEYDGLYNLGWLDEYKENWKLIIR